MEVPYTYYEDEVREGFYISGVLKRAWASQLEVLAEIDKVCKKHNIRWFIDCGTLLGAVRHGGYIPWDDDLDICMQRDDLKRFNQIALSELPKDYVLLNMHNEKEDWGEYITRVTNSHALTFEAEYLEKYHNCPYSIGIDIFPLDYLCPDDEEEELRRELAKKVMTICESYEAEEENYEVLEPYIQEVEELCQVKIDRNNPLKPQLFKLTEAIFSMYNASEATHVALMTYWVSHHNHKYPIECFKDTVMLPFEYTYLPAPMLYDDVLKIEYGDYMTIYKGGGVHEYPFYKKQEYHFIEALPSYPFVYKFKQEHLEKNPLPIKKSKQDGESFVQLLNEAHGIIVNLIALGQLEPCATILEQCQENAIRMGEQIEADFFLGHPTVKVLEEYCELVYEISQMLDGGELNPEASSVVEEAFVSIMSNLYESIVNDVINRKEILFIPFKPCYWEAMESVWQEKLKEDNTDVYVMPVPYYEREVDGTLVNMHYEVEDYPDYVHVVNYNEYDIINRHPDEIYIQNPYDECNFTACVEPAYFSRFLKRYTDKLIYIPYFIMDEVESKDSKAWVTMDYFCTVPGVVHADKVIVQSENTRNMYIEKLTDMAGEETRHIWEEKIYGDGSPLFEVEKEKQRQLVASIREDIPSEWKNRLYKEDGSSKKVVFFKTGIAVLAKYGIKAVDKIKRSLEIFKENKSDVLVIWGLSPEVWKVFIGKTELLLALEELVMWYKESDIGIYDDSANHSQAILLCDAYYGEVSSVARKCSVDKKPVMLMNVDI